MGIFKKLFYISGLSLIALAITLSVLIIETVINNKSSQLLYLLYSLYIALTIVILMILSTFIEMCIYYVKTTNRVKSCDNLMELEST